MRFLSKGNSIITVLTIVSTTLIKPLENTKLSDCSENSSSPSTWSTLTPHQESQKKSESNERVIDVSAKEVEEEAQAGSQNNSTTQTSDSNGPVEKDVDKEAESESRGNSTTQAADSDRSAISAKKEVRVLQQSLQEMKQNRDEINKLYQCSLTENENLAKRYQKQIEEAKIFGIQNFGKDLLDVADVLHKAIESVPKDQVTDNNPHLKNLYEGLTMAESELKTVFNRHGLEVFNPIDEKFNANFHEALFEQEVEGKPSGIVFVVSKPGYKLGGRVIRPALVGVTK